jgi:hypothetical protein
MLQPIRVKPLSSLRGRGLELLDTSGVWLSVDSISSARIRDCSLQAANDAAPGRGAELTGTGFWLKMARFAPAKSNQVAANPAQSLGDGHSHQSKRARTR